MHPRQLQPETPMVIPNPDYGPRYLRDIDVAHMCGISRGTVWRWTREGKLSCPTRLSAGTTRWLSTEDAARDLGAWVSRP